MKLGNGLKISKFGGDSCTRQDSESSVGVYLIACMLINSILLATGNLDCLS